MSAQALATVMGPPLMLHSANAPGAEVDHAQPIAVLKYLLQIWPQPQSAVISGNVTVCCTREMNGFNCMVLLPLCKYLIGIECMQIT